MNRAESLKWFTENLKPKWTVTSMLVSDPTATSPVYVLSDVHTLTISCQNFGAARRRIKVGEIFRAAVAGPVWWSSVVGGIRGSSSTVSRARSAVTVDVAEVLARDSAMVVRALAR